ncbi:MAG: extracellular solute-binding protein [Clostridia bacterium]|nr:extracellular solute-binding protein [Clostridia bacterium]
MKTRKIWALTLVLALLIGAMGGVTGSFSAKAEEITFPLAEPITLTAWRVAATSDPKLGITTYNDIEAVQAWEKATNVHIEWQIPPSGQEQENFNLMIASGDYPDLIFDVAQYYVGGLDKAISDGVIVPLNDYMDNRLSDYNALISRNETVYKDCKTDEGNFPAVYFINTPDQGPWYGMAIRQDWLDELGLAAPVTYDDWHTVLKAFKDKYGSKSPLWLNYHAGDVFSVFSAGYGVSVLGASGAGFINVDGTVKYSPIEDGYRDYITMLHEWYEEGLIDPDFYSNTTATYIPPDDLWATGNAGAWPDIYTLLDIRPYMGADENNKDMNVVPIAAPVRNEGDTLHLRQYNFTRGTNACAISTACKNPELAAAYLNLGSKQEYAWLAYYGVEGDTYNVVDGKPVYTDKILHNPDGLSASDAMTKFCFRSAGMYIWDRELQTAGPKALSAINDIWPSNADGNYMMPNITMTSDEANRYSVLMGDISTFVEENTTKFILGSRDLSEWDSYVQSVKSMGVEEAVSLQQAALDRFNGR